MGSNVDDGVVKVKIEENEEGGETGENCRDGNTRKTCENSRTQNNKKKKEIEEAMVNSSRLQIILEALTSIPLQSKSGASSSSSSSSSIT